MNIINYTFIFDWNRRYIFPVKCVLEIPSDDNKRPYFPIGHEVLSLYPNSSCFYKATIIKTPNEVKFIIYFYFIQ